MADLFTLYQEELTRKGEAEEPPPKADAAQQAALPALERVRAELMQARAPRLPKWWPWIQGTPAPVRGVYLYGPVGRGKTFLMDLFSRALLWPEPRKRRLHFHTFMQEVHARLHQARQQPDRADGGDVEGVARALARDTRLLCLDEFQVTNVADALILARLFTALFEAGLVLVATSNTPPDGLYEGGLQRELFVPFIPLLQRCCEAVPVRGEVDYRRRRLSNAPVYVCPEDEAALARDFAVLTDGAAGEPVVVEVAGKKVQVARAAHGVAWMPASALETQSLWVPEFHALADAFPTLLLSGLQPIGHEQSNRAERFIAFIDVWYDRQAKLILSAAVAPEWLYPAGPLVKRFERTVSRLYEMQEKAWWEKPVRPQ